MVAIVLESLIHNPGESKPENLDGTDLHLRSSGAAETRWSADRRRLSLATIALQRTSKSRHLVPPRLDR
jgi:hypothetical protein